MDKYLSSLKEKRLSEKKTAMIISQAASALAYLHTNGIHHRDIKLGNVTIDDKGHVYLIDFGFVIDSWQDKLTNFCGTPCYMCPEIVLKKAYLGH